MVVAACSTNQVNEQPVTNLPLPPSGYSGLAWLLGGTLVIADPGRLTEDTTSRLLFLDELSTGDYTAVSAKSEGCLVREFHSPVALSNGSVAFQELCGVEVPGRLPAEEWSLRQLKGPTEQDLAFLLNRPLDFFPGPFSVGPSLDQAIVSVAPRAASGASRDLTPNDVADGSVLELTERCSVFLPLLSQDGRVPPFVEGVD
jgi:hypothetical protein